MKYSRNVKCPDYDAVDVEKGNNEFNLCRPDFNLLSIINRNTFE